MLTALHPKLPMRQPSVTRQFYESMGFHLWGNVYPEYLMMERDGLQIHFFLHNTLNPIENDGQVYVRTNQIETLYNAFLENRVPIHPQGMLETKPWGQREFSVLDPDHNLLTFGQQV